MSTMNTDPKFVEFMNMDSKIPSSIESKDSIVYFVNRKVLLKEHMRSALEMKHLRNQREFLMDILNYIKNSEDLLNIDETFEQIVGVQLHELQIETDLLLAEKQSLLIEEEVFVKTALDLQRQTIHLKRDGLNKWSDVNIVDYTDKHDALHAQRVQMHSEERIFMDKKMDHLNRDRAFTSKMMGIFPALIRCVTSVEITTFLFNRKDRLDEQQFLIKKLWTLIDREKQFIQNRLKLDHSLLMEHANAEMTATLRKQWPALNTERKVIAWNNLDSIYELLGTEIEQQFTACDAPITASVSTDGSNSAEKFLRLDEKRGRIEKSYNTVTAHFFSDRDLKSAMLENELLSIETLASTDADSNSASVRTLLNRELSTAREYMRISMTTPLA